MFLNILFVVYLNNIFGTLTTIEGNIVDEFQSNSKPHYSTKNTHLCRKDSVKDKIIFFEADYFEFVEKIRRNGEILFKFLYNTPVSFDSIDKLEAHKFTEIAKKLDGFFSPLSVSQAFNFFLDEKNHERIKKSNFKKDDSDLSELISLIYQVIDIFKKESELLNLDHTFSGKNFFNKKLIISLICHDYREYTLPSEPEYLLFFYSNKTSMELKSFINTSEKKILRLFFFSFKSGEIFLSDKNIRTLLRLIYTRNYYETKLAKIMEADELHKLLYNDQKSCFFLTKSNTSKNILPVDYMNNIYCLTILLTYKHKDAFEDFFMNILAIFKPSIFDPSGQLHDDFDIDCFNAALATLNSFKNTYDAMENDANLKKEAEFCNFHFVDDLIKCYNAFKAYIIA